jgi:DNA invertase Pin-like site-specific DNA recombinase
MSTDRQSRFGFSLEAQREMVGKYIVSSPGKLIAEYAETKSGRRNARPKLAEALYVCRTFRAVLLIARLDRLSRNVAMIARLLESKVDFVAVDFPHANRFTLHILAAIAEHESRLLSERMKAVVAAIRARGEGWKLRRRPVLRGFPLGSQAKGAQVRRERAEARTRDLGPIVWKALSEGKSYAMIAEEFNRRGIRPPQKTPWGMQAIEKLAKDSRADFAPAAAVRRLKPAGMRRMKMLLLFEDIKSLLLKWRREGVFCREMAAELDRLGIRSPRGNGWSACTVGRYLKRALNVPKLRQMFVFEDIKPLLLRWKRKGMTFREMATELDRLEIRSPRNKGWKSGATVWRYLKRATNVPKPRQPRRSRKARARR